MFYTKDIRHNGPYSELIFIAKCADKTALNDTINITIFWVNCHFLLKKELFYKENSILDHIYSIFMPFLTDASIKMCPGVYP